MRHGQRLLGFALLAVSIPFLISEWRTLINEGYYHPKAAALFPMFAVAGLGMILSPVDYDRLQAEHGVDRITLFRHLPAIWRIWSFIALAAAFGNWIAMANY